MYPMDRIQQKHARQIDLLENLTAVIQDYPNPACIRDETGKFIFCNTLFHESFLTQDQSAEKWLLSQRDFCELISVTEMGAYRNEHTHLNLVEDVFIQNRFWTISVQSFLNGHRNIILWQFYDAAHVRHKDSYNQKTIVSDDIRNIIRRMSDDSSVSSYVNDVFYLYSTGISHNAIARILNISISTSKKHASLICDYFSVSNKDELIILLYNKKFIHYLYEKAMCIINTR
ncbi:conjugal transfer transcriptional regulator TraJ [Escherichia coli]|nr:conjugal transfer transcriptional regulator TraJ [Escherichia coli]